MTDILTDVEIFRTVEEKEYLTERDAYQDVLDLIVDELDCEIGYLHLYDIVKDELNLTVWSRKVTEICNPAGDSHYPLSKAGIWADCIRFKKTVIHNNYRKLKSKNGLPEDHVPLQNHMSTAIRFPKGSYAIVGVGNESTAFTETDARHFEKLVQQGIKVTVQKINAVRHNKRTLDLLFAKKNSTDTLAQLIASMGRAVELKDNYTSEHQMNVAFTASRIGEKMRLSEDDLFGLKLGASIHDIGKIGTPADLLNKTRKLTVAEYELLKQHAQDGGNIFEDVQTRWPLHEMIVHHHERQDGSGYPFGLSGSEICLEARIIAIADIFDAMANDRPYRKAPGSKAAIDEIMKGSGTIFDQYVVAAFLDCYAEDPTFEGRYPQA